MQNNIGFLEKVLFNDLQYQVEVVQQMEKFPEDRRELNDGDDPSLGFRTFMPSRKVSLREERQDHNLYCSK
jgi:hypothetical protein